MKKRLGVNKKITTPTSDLSENHYSQKIKQKSYPQNKKKSTKNKYRQKKESGLGGLTKNFLKFIKNSSNRIINLNDAVKALKFKKRRIYDITNVIEGKNFFRKKLKICLLFPFQAGMKKAYSLQNNIIKFFNLYLLFRVGVHHKTRKIYDSMEL